MSINTFKVDEGIRFAPQTVPSSPVSGDQYYDSSYNSFVFRQDGFWHNLASRDDVASAANLTSANFTAAKVQNTFLRVTGSTAGTIHGLTASGIAKALIIYNVSSVTQVIANQSATEGTAGNRIITGIGTNFSLSSGTSATLTYDDAQSRWVMTSSAGANTTLSNLSSPTAINTELNLPNGTAAVPSLAFTSDRDGSGTGLYRVGANSLGFSANGTNIGQYSALGAWTLGPTIGLGTGTGAYHRTIGAIHGSLGGTGVLWSIANRETITVGAQIYYDSAGTLKALVTESGYTYTSFINGISGTVFSLVTNADAQTADTALVTTNQKNLLTFIGSGAATVGPTGGGVTHQLNGNVNITQGLSTARTDDNSTGTVNNLSSTNRTYIRLQASTTITLNGIAAGSNGQIIILENATGNTATINHQNANAVGSQIDIPGGRSAYIEQLGTALLIYDAALNKWMWLENTESRSAQNYAINGDMRLAQEFTSYVNPTTGTAILDMYRTLFTSNTLAHTITQDTDVPTAAQANYLFQNSLKYDVTTADVSIAATEFALIQHRVEGYNWTNIAQKPFTLSFWVKAGTTGTYCVSFRNSANTLSYVAEYVVNAVNTWEFKTILISASPAGTWNYTNGIGVSISWILAGGSTFQTGSPNTWINANALCTSNQVNVIGDVTKDFWLTGVMLNEGAFPAPFSLAGKTVDGELELAARCYEKSYDFGLAPGTTTPSGDQGSVNYSAQSTNGVFCVTQKRKRFAPTITIYSANSGASGQIYDFTATSDKVATVNGVGQKYFQVNAASVTALDALSFQWVSDARL